METTIEKAVRGLFESRTTTISDADADTQVKFWESYFTKNSIERPVAFMYHETKDASYLSKDVKSAYRDRIIEKLLAGQPLTETENSNYEAIRKNSGVVDFSEELNKREYIDRCGMKRYAAELRNYLKLHYSNIYEAAAKDGRKITVSPMFATSQIDSIIAILQGLK